jgi:hypothetical protein
MRMQLMPSPWSQPPESIPRRMDFLRTVRAAVPILAVSMRRRRFLRLPCWGAALLASATVAGPALGQAPYRVSYSAPEGCPSEEAFRSDVSAQVNDPAHGDGAQLDIVITERGGGYQGELVVTDRLGATDRLHLELEHPEPSCAAVAHALAFKASIAVRYGGHFEPPPEPPRPPPRQLAPPPPSPLPQKASPTVAFTVHTAVGLLGGLGPRVRPMVELGGSVGENRARLFSPWMSLSVDAAQGVLPSPLGNGELWLIRGRSLASLLRLGSAAFFLRPCAGLAVGAVRATPPPAAKYLESPTNLWLSIELAAHVRWNVTPGFFAQAEGGPALLVVGERYLLDGSPGTLLYTSPRVSASASLGLGLQL